MSDDYDGKVNGEVVLNLADWIERRRDAVGPYADHIIHSVRAHEAEISRLRAEVERLTAAHDSVCGKLAGVIAALSDERAHADALAGALFENAAHMTSTVRGLLAQHRARRQG